MQGDFDEMDKLFDKFKTTPEDQAEQARYEHARKLTPEEDAAEIAR